jgi:iron complex outermembrane receptor protein
MNSESLEKTGKRQLQHLRWHQFLVVAAIGFAGLLCGAPAMAQSDASTSPGQETQMTGIETVYSTARKRVEPLQNTPVASTVLGGQALELKYVTDLKDMAFPAPNVNISRLGSFTNGVSVFIRGIGNTDNDSTVDPPVAIFVDGVYIPRPENSSLDLFDVEQIEIMRGPQGTLFGRNTSAGAIQVRTRRPSGEFATRGRLTVGEYGRLDVRAAVEFPLVEDKLAFKVAVLSTHMDGYYRDPREGGVTGKRKGKEDTFSVRPILQFTPNDDLKITLIGEYVRIDSEPTPGVNASAPTQILCAQWGFCGRQPARGVGEQFISDDYIVSFDTDTLIDNRVWGITGEIEWDVGPGTITSISNYRETESLIILDVDQTVAPMFSTERDSPHKQYSTELRYASTNWDNFDFVAGVFYFYQDHFLARRTFQMITPTSPMRDLRSDTGQTHKSFSVFAEGNYHVTEDLTITVGGRWSHEKKSFFQEPFGAFPNTGPRISPDPVSWDNFGPKAGISYQVRDNVLAYFTYSRGFKSGGWNGRGGTATTIGPYDPEVVDAFEFGIKSDFFDNRVRLNLALFWNDYEDLQRTVIRFLPGAANPQETVTSNAASASVKGVEFELTALPVEGLQLNANIAYLDAGYSSFCADLNGPSMFDMAPTSPCGGESINITDGTTGPGLYLLDDDFSGTPLQRAPKWQLTLGATYEFAVGDAGFVVLNASYNYVSNLNVEVRGFPLSNRGKVNLVDASITFKDVDDRFSLSVYGKNMTNERYLNNYTAVAALFDIYGISSPSRWGVELSWNL